MAVHRFPVARVVEVAVLKAPEVFRGKEEEKSPGVFEARILWNTVPE